MTIKYSYGPCVMNACTKLCVRNERMHTVRFYQRLTANASAQCAYTHNADLLCVPVHNVMHPLLLQTRAFSNVCEVSRQPMFA